MKVVSLFHLFFLEAYSEGDGSVCVPTDFICWAWR